MRIVSEEMTDRWKSAIKLGITSRPTVRATVQRINQRTYPYNTGTTAGGDIGVEKDRVGTYTSVIFGCQVIPQEIRNITASTWGRSTDQDVAEGSLTILNTDVIPIGNTDESVPTDSFDLPGLLTYNRGDEKIAANRWGYDSDTGWNGKLVPDRMIRTYEGYGADLEVAPAYDANLQLAGTWMIDDVTYNHEGNIVVSMRDVGRLLIDQICFPPVVPLSEYPMTWSTIRSEKVTRRDATGGSWDFPHGRATSSNNVYVGEGIVDDPPPYVSGDGSVRGHRAQDALTAIEDSEPEEGEELDYWLSTGQSTYGSKVWWEVDLHSPQNIAAVRMTPRGGPYRVYISLADKDGWIGRKHIPYTVTTEGVNIGAGIPFVHTRSIDHREMLDITLPKKYAHVTKIRITFTRLWNNLMGNYPYHAGLRMLKIYTGPLESLDFAKGDVLKVVGNYQDFTSIVKWMGAWGGWYWPPHNTGDDFIQFGGFGDPPDDFEFVAPDVTLDRGRIWGDFMMTGTAGEADLTPDQYDKQPLMDVIASLKEITGFLFFIDECGGMVWRLPNLWKLGNYLSPHHLTPHRLRQRTDDIVVIDEEETLISYSTKLSSRNLRERVFVASTTGKIGVVVEGFNPYPENLRRMCGWTDQHFANNRECIVAADMIVAQQAFSYRTANITIPGYPAIQIDDQIRVFERVTNETFYHYVKSVSSSLDMRAGTWTYDLETHWLGERPSDAWVVDVNILKGATKAYLQAIWSQDEDEDDEDDDDDDPPEDP